MLISPDLYLIVQDHIHAVNTRMLLLPECHELAWWYSPPPPPPAPTPTPLCAKTWNGATKTTHSYYYCWGLLLLSTITVEDYYCWALLLLSIITVKDYYCWALLLLSTITVEDYYCWALLLLSTITVEHYYCWGLLLLSIITVEQVVTTSIRTSCTCDYLKTCWHWILVTRQHCPMEITVFALLCMAMLWAVHVINERGHATIGALYPADLASQ